MAKTLCGRIRPHTFSKLYLKLFWLSSRLKMRTGTSPFNEGPSIRGCDFTDCCIIEVPLDHGKLQVEIDNDSTGHPEQPHIIEELCSVRLRQSGNRLAFYNDS